MAQPNFATENSIAISTLQSHNVVTRENLVENDSGKVYQALLEANMATEVNLIALVCLGLFCIYLSKIHSKDDVKHFGIRSRNRIISEDAVSAIHLEQLNNNK
ncbi:hypothetical protein PUN28_014640 [Cardiocondyla obscurior]|uniref:Uncharacterized protein n=1 Tax=Cardiocondyla obscurior TaxID=286306 RepID=A0AAW2F2S6_9HYME